MENKQINYSFNVEVVESGQLKSYGDSFYSYKITSTQSEYDVKRFCMNFLKKSYSPDNMPNPFSGELLEFKKLTDNNNCEKWDEPQNPEIYLYKIKKLYTG